MALNFSYDLPPAIFHISIADKFLDTQIYEAESWADSQGVKGLEWLRITWEFLQ